MDYLFENYSYNTLVEDNLYLSKYLQAQITAGLTLHLYVLS